MLSYKSVCFLLMLILFAAYSYGQVWKQYTDSAEILEEQRKMNEAIEFYSKTRDILMKDSTGTITYAASCNNLAGIYKRTGKYADAAQLYLEVKRIRETLLGKGHPDYAATCNNLAVIYQQMDLYEKAEQLYIEAKSVWEKIPGKYSQDYAISCNNLANIYLLMGQYERAELLYLEAKEIREKILGKENKSYALTCNSLANLYMDMGKYEQAELLLFEAKQIREKTPGKCSQEYTYSCTALANLYQDIGLYEKAKPLYLEAKQIQEEVSGKENRDYVYCCVNLANFYAKILQHKEAESLYLEAKQILQKLHLNKNIEYAAICNGLAIVYRHTKGYKKAELLLLEVKEIWEKVLGSKEHGQYAGSIINLANLYDYMGQSTKAELLYNEAKQIQKRVLRKFHPEYGISCENLAILYRTMHQPLKAEEELKELLAVNTFNVSNIFQFINEQEKNGYIKNILGEDNNAYSFYVSEKMKSGQPYSFSLFHRNLILSSLQTLKKQVFSANDTSLLKKYEEWITLKKQLAVLYALSNSERTADVTPIEEKAGLLEKELARLSAAFSKQTQKADWKDIQNNLQPDEAAIEFVSFHFTNGYQDTDSVFYAAFVLRKDSLLPATVFLFREKQLQDLLFSAGYKTTKEGVERLYTLNSTGINKKAAIKSIYELIWKPLEKELTGIKTIYFSPSGLLHRIAFAALPVNKKELLSDRYKLVQLSTTASVADQQPYYVADSDKIQLYGGISYNADTTALKDVALVYHYDVAVNRSLPDDLTRSGQWNELPGTNKEIEGIASLSGNYQTNITSHSGINATEESLKSLDGNASPAVLHIATHGFFFPDPKQDNNSRKNDERENVFKLSDDPLMRSGLLFAGANNAWQNKPVAGIDDGILTAYEVSNLYLPNTKLVVLSACETGLGDIQGNEGVYGLQRAFKMAGAQNLVMSLWKVSDLETAEFMEAFYKNMFSHQSVSDAFYNAQEIMKNKYRQQPYKWAAWVLVR